MAKKYDTLFNKDVPFEKRIVDITKLNYSAAHDIVDSALQLYQAYLIGSPNGLSGSEANALAELGKQVGRAASALEEQVKVLEKINVL